MLQYGIKQEFDGAFLKENETVTTEIALIPGVGNASNFENVDVEGKIAVITRGTISFSEKARNAQNNGAIGVIIRKTSTNTSMLRLKTTSLSPYVRLTSLMTYPLLLIFSTVSTLSFST